MEKNENPVIKLIDADLTNDPEGYPLYPEDEDIYTKFQKAGQVDPENVLKLKVKEQVGVSNEKDFEEDFTGGDLDIPGTELDENMETSEIEDEENNYFSLGGDDHMDLEEDLG